MSTSPRLEQLAVAIWLVIAATSIAAETAVEGKGITAPTDSSSRATPIPGSCHKPEYPLSSIRKQEQGLSIIQLRVDANGAVTDTSVRLSSGSRLLDQAAAGALSVCRFRPARDASGTPIKSVYSESFEWRLENAPKDPWVGLRALAGAGFAPTNDFSTIPFAGDSAGNPEQRAKILQAARDEAADKALCPSIERATTRISFSDEKSERRSFESWTLVQCGYSMRYVVAIAFPENKRPLFRMMPLAPGEVDPFASR